MDWVLRGQARSPDRAILIVAAQCALEIRELEEAERFARQAYKVAAID